MTTAPSRKIPPVWQYKIDNPDQTLIAGRKVDFVAENVLPSSMSGEHLCMSGMVVYDPRFYDGDLKYRTKVMLNIGFDNIRNRPSSKNKNSINNLLFNKHDTMSNIYKHIHPTGASLSPSGNSEIRIVNYSPSGR